MSSRPDEKIEKAANEPSARPPSRNILPEVITSSNVVVSPPLPPDQVIALHDESGKGKPKAREGGKSELLLSVPTHEEEDKEHVPIPAAQMAANLEARDQDLQKKLLKNDGTADRAVPSSVIANRLGNGALVPPAIDYANSSAPTKSSSNCAGESLDPVATTNTSRIAPETGIPSNQTAAVVYRENNSDDESNPGNSGGNGSPEPGTPVLEATLVEEQPSAPVYNAVVVPVGGIDNGGNEDIDDRDKVPPASWWKKHKILISVSVIAIILFGGLMATIGALMTSNNNGSRDNNNDSNPSSNVVDGNNNDSPGTGIESTNSPSTSMTSPAIDNENVDDSNSLVDTPTQTPFYPPVPTSFPKSTGPDLTTPSPTTVAPVLAPAPTTVPDMISETDSPTTPYPNTFQFPTQKPLLETPAPMTRPSPFGFPTAGPDLELDTGSPTTRAPMTRPSPFGFPTTGPDLELDTSSPTTPAPMTRPSPFGFPTTGPDLELDTSSPTTRAPSSAIAETCTPYTATFEKSMFAASCTGNCSYGDVMLAVDGGVAAVSRSNEQLVFYENTLSFGQGSNAGPGFVLTASTIFGPLVSKATSMALYGDTAVVGFAEEDVAFVYERNSATGEWSKSTELSASFNTTTRANTRHRHARMRANRKLTVANNRLMQGNSSVSDTNTNTTKLIRFGHSVDIRKDLIVVGAIDDGDNSDGRVYVFRRVNGEWVRDGRLGNLASGPRTEDFGSSVSANGIVIVVGDDRYGDTDQGAFYVFHYDFQSWLQMQSAFVSTLCDRRFASHVELLDQYQLFVSCPEENNSSGALYYYTRSTMWTQSSNIFTRKQTLVASDLRASEQFGVHSSSYGTTAVIGTKQSENGRVVVFALENGTWVEKTVIGAPTGLEQGFGHRVAYDGNKMLIASHGNAYSYSLDCIVKV